MFRRISRIINHITLYHNVYILLILIKIILYFIPIKYIFKILQHKKTKKSKINISTIYKIISAIKKSEYIFNWKNSCLVKAIAGKLILNSRNCNTQIYIGIKKTNNRSLTSHAWLKYNNLNLLGGQNDCSFKIIYII